MQIKGWALLCKFQCCQFVSTNDSNSFFHCSHLFLKIFYPADNGNQHMYGHLSDSHMCVCVNVFCVCVHIHVCVRDAHVCQYESCLYVYVQVIYIHVCDLCKHVHIFDSYAYVYEWQGAYLCHNVCIVLRRYPRLPLSLTQSLFFPCTID